MYTIHIQRQIWISLMLLEIQMEKEKYHFLLVLQMHQKDWLFGQEKIKNTKPEIKNSGFHYYT